VVEKNEQRASVLARQRPSWLVIEGDAVKVINAGAFQDQPVNFLDCDPYGSAWPVLYEFFNTDHRARAEHCTVVVNDGLRLNLGVGRAWTNEHLKEFVTRFGNKYVYLEYLKVCEALLTEYAAIAGYSVRAFGGYYTGFAQKMTHFWAKLHLDGDR